MTEEDSTENEETCSSGSSTEDVVQVSSVEESVTSSPSAAVSVLKDKVVFDLTGMSEVFVENGDSLCSKLYSEFDKLVIAKNDTLSFSKFTNKETGKRMKMIVKFVEDDTEVV
jgi:hypothetical protein